MKEIQKVAVIGSGVMGSAIAAHVANSGAEVLLLDIVPKQGGDRNALAKGAVEKLLKADPAPLTHRRVANRITPGNLEDHLDRLKDCQWIIEAVLENLDIKRDLYSKIEKVRAKDAVVSSNTSTIPLHHLIEGRSTGFRKHFMITHFFNPPRYMRLLELVGSAETDAKALSNIRHFCDVRLGKGVVDCKDTPGFIANRIGCFWMTAGVLEAMRLGVTVEQADAVMGRPVGIPKTGVFGLLDLIGIDLMPLIASEMAKTLPKSDAFITMYEEPKLVRDMIKDGYTGRKGKGGFYRLNTEGGGKVKEAKNLKDGSYGVADKPKLASVEAAKAGLRALVEHEDIGGQYAAAVLSKTLAYAASLVPEIADDVVAVDEAMRLGYNWKYGPFELIDRLGGADKTGATWLAEYLEKQGEAVPALLKKAAKQPFYGEVSGKRYYLNTQGAQKEIPAHPGVSMLADFKRGKTPLLKNPSAKAWDIGDGILCFEYTSKMNSIDPLTLELLVKATERVKKDFRGMVIANDSDNFCVGANIGFLLFAANTGSWKSLDGIIKQGQDTYMGLKYAPFPVVGAVSGMALGGGCEVLLHCDAVQAHVEMYSGLVEVGVGVIPGWGGCKEMLLRHLEADTAKRLSLAQKGGMFALAVKEAVEGKGTASLRHPINTVNTMPAVSASFEQIALAKVSKSAEEAKDMLILTGKDRVSMNRSRLLSDAKARCLELSVNYVAPKPATLRLPGRTAKTALTMAIQGFAKSGKATPHDVVVSNAVAEVLSGGNTDITRELTEQNLLDLEREAFGELIRTKATWDRIQHMLEKGKPLRN